MHTARQEKERGIVSSHWLGEFFEKSCYVKEGIENASVTGEKSKPHSLCIILKCKSQGEILKIKSSQNRNRRRLYMRTEFPENGIT